MPASPKGDISSRFHMILPHSSLGFRDDAGIGPYGIAYGKTGLPAYFVSSSTIRAISSQCFSISETSLNWVRARSRLCSG